MAYANNSLAPQQQQAPFSVIISSPNYQEMLSRTVQDEKKRQHFVTSIITAVSENERLARCDPQSILGAGLKCLNYNFYPGGDTGDVYLVPYGSKCTFQLGYKGLIKLAQRSGVVKALNMDVLRDGETVVVDRLSGDVVITGEPKDIDAPAIGYFAFIRLSNGFEKTEYMSKAQAVNHATKYASSNFDPILFAKYENYLRTGEGMTKQEADRQCSGVYYTNFDQMAMKNVMRRLLLRWAPLSVDMQQFINDEGKVETADDDDDFFGNDNIIDGDTGEVMPKEEPAAHDPKAKKSAAEDADFFN